MVDEPKKSGLIRKLIALKKIRRVRCWAEVLGRGKCQMPDATRTMDCSAGQVRVDSSERMRPTVGESRCTFDEPDPGTFDWVTIQEDG
jgi:hypothetical protein